MSTINVDIVAPQSGTSVTVSGVDISSPNIKDTIIGEGAGESITSGQQNTILGFEAMNKAEDASYNVALGQESLHEAVNSSVQSNVAVGIGPLYYLTDGEHNVAVGVAANDQLATGDDNSSVGDSAGSLTTSGNRNVYFGSRAGRSLASGDENVFIGAGAGASFIAPFTFQTSGNNNVLIGANSRPATSSASNAITLGNSSHTVIRAAVTTITSLSDERDKKEITELSAGLDFVKTLKPVEFVWDDRDENGRHDIKDFGFIAQDLKKSQEDAELAETLKLVYEENPEKLEATYGRLIPVLVKAIQDLSAKVEALEAQ
jgi:hypothetical protein